MLSFILAALIGRALGDAGLATYATALAWVFPLSLLADFGMSTLLTREIARTPSQASALLKTTWVARLLLGGTLMTALVASAPLLHDDPQVIDALRLSAPLILVQPLYGSYAAVFRARQDMRPVASLNLGMLGAQVLLTGLALAAGTDIRGVMALNTATSTGQLAAAWWLYRRRPAAVGASPPPLAALLWQARSFALAGVLGALALRLNLLLLGQLSSLAVVGAYVAAQRFIDAGAVLARGVYDAAYPALAADASHLKRIFRRVLAWLTAGAIVFGMGVSVGAEILITAVYGAGFADAVPVLQLAAWSLLPNVLRNARIVYWYARGEEAYTNRVYVVSLILQSVLALLLMPRFGAIGAVWVSILTDTAASLMLWGFRRSATRGPYTPAE